MNYKKLKVTIKHPNLFHEETYLAIPTDVGYDPDYFTMAFYGICSAIQDGYLKKITDYLQSIDFEETEYNENNSFSLDFPEALACSFLEDKKSPTVRDILEAMQQACPNRWDSICILNETDFDELNFEF